jgi:hypothetical protein
MTRTTKIYWLGIICAVTYILHAQAKENFRQEFELHGVRFVVEATDEGSLNQLTITPSGLTISNDPATKEIDGRVTGADIADLDIDGYPEIYVWVNSAGSGSYGSVIGYAVNNGKSMSEVYFPEFDESKKYFKGYMGHDEFAVVESTFVRRFPIYKPSDSNAEPTGGTRQLQYKLQAGEAGWKLVVDKVVEY